MQKMNRFLTGTVFFTLTAAFCLSLFSCDMLWNGGLLEKINEETTTEIHFYSGRGKDAKTAVRRYKIGETIRAEDLPTADRKDSETWMQEMQVGGWKFYRWTADPGMTERDATVAVDEKDVITQITVPADGIDLYAVRLVKFTVVTKEQNTDGSTYTALKTEEKTGFPEADTNVTAEEREGFNLTIANTTIAEEDGKTVVEVKYDRKTTKITLDADGGTFADGSGTKGFQGLYGAAFDKDSVEKPKSPAVGSKFDRWQPALPEMFGAEDITCKAAYEGYKVDYTVVYYEQNTDGSSYEETGRETKPGTPGTTTNVIAEERVGFITPVGFNLTIAEDGSTVVEVKYDRKTTKITLDADGGTFADGSGTKEFQGLYGAAFDKNSVEKPESPAVGSKFDRWQPALPGTFGAEDSEYTAQYEIIPTGGDIVIGKWTCTFRFSDDNNTITGSADGTITVTATVTRNGVEEVYTGAALSWVNIEVYTMDSSDNIASSAGITISNGTVTILAYSLPPEKYRLYVSGTPPGCPETFSGELHFTVQ